MVGARHCVPDHFYFMKLELFFDVRLFCSTLTYEKKSLKWVPFPYLPNVKDPDNRLNLHFSHREFKV